MCLVPTVTQCPIGPGESYHYKFNADNIGTHWYHAHTGMQRTDGLYGAFIVYDDRKNEKKSTTTNNYEHEYLFLVQDWNNRLWSDLYKYPLWKNFKYTHGYDNNSTCALRLRIDDLSILPTVPQDTVIINGKGWHNLTANSSDIFNLGLDLLKFPLETFNVKANSKYLFRVVGANNAFSLVISFESHKIRVVATDGNRIKPIDSVDQLIIHGGERYDFELETKDENFANNYLIFVKLLAVADESFQGIIA